MAVKFNMVFGFERLLPMLGYQHVLMAFIIIAIILLSLLLAGCSSSSPLIPSIYLISLWYDKSAPPTYNGAIVDPTTPRLIGDIVKNAHMETRVGYFGVCVNPTGGSWLCSANASSLAAQIQTEDDPLNLIWVADTFRANIVFPYLLIIAVILAFITLLILATYPNSDREYENGPTRRRLPGLFISQISLAVIFVAGIFVLVSVLWQHTASVAAATIAANLGNGSIESGVGVTSMVLGWFSFALLMIVVIGLLVMILSIHLVERLADREEYDDDDLEDDDDLRGDR